MNKTGLILIFLVVVAAYGQKDIASIDVDELLVRKTVLTTNLMAIFGASDMPTKVNIVRAIGELRLEGAVNLLLDNIELEPERPSQAGKVCVTALKRIGMPSIRPLINRILQEPRRQIRFLYVAAVVEILGTRLAECALKLEADKLQTGIGAERLKEALEDAKTLYAKGP
jgi:hypothetical protein